MKNRTVLITGATSGIGKSTAWLLAEKKYRLILTGRREDRLASIAEELSDWTEVKTLSFDVRDKKAVFEAIESLPEEWKEIEILINNAGNAHGLAPIQSGDIEDWEAMIDINVKGLLYVSKAVVPGMVERMSGHIVNIGSIAGKEVYPNGNVYCASKHAVDAINNGMRLDLNQYGIKVSQINPGLVETEFSMVRFKGDKEKADNVYKGIDPLTGDDIAEIIAFILERPGHVNISDLVVFPTAQASSTIVNRLD
jgi:NADP-dependent 3-hydroxy acid dehydrogenase YdfG